MTVAELIYDLGTLDPDSKVVVKYRDEGGPYEGYDENIRLIKRNIEGEDCIIL